MGHLITSEGLKLDPEKLKAVFEIPMLTDVAGIQRFIGFGKFLPKLSDECEPLRQLTVKDAEWSWTPTHDAAVNRIKKLVTAAPVLRYYDPQEELILQCDASDTGLGAVLLQKEQPIAFFGRALAECERNYAQIEKELLAVIYGLEKFHQYTLGCMVTIQSDHKLLEMIAKKSLLKAPKCLQCLLM